MGLVVTHNEGKQLLSRLWYNMIDPSGRKDYSSYLTMCGMWRKVRMLVGGSACLLSFGVCSIYAFLHVYVVRVVLSRYVPRSSNVRGLTVDPQSAPNYTHGVRTAYVKIP